MYSGLHAETVELLNQNAYQEASITVTLANNTTLMLTNADIISGSLSVDRYSMSSSSISVGNAIAAEMNVTIENHDGRFNSVSFAGAKMVLSIIVTDPNRDSHYWRSIPMGTFYVEGSPRSLSSIAIRALDKMTWLDAPVDRTKFTADKYALTLFVSKILSETGVFWSNPTATRFSSVPNHGIYIEGLPATNSILTYRQLLMWVGGLCGINWYIDWDGYLNFGWYSVGDTDPEVDPEPNEVLIANAGTCYSSDLHNDIVSITGLFYKEENTGQEWLVGTADYALDLSGNKLMDLTRQTINSTYAQPDVVMNTAYNAGYGSVGYNLFDAEIKPAPYLWPMDAVVYTRIEDGEPVVYGTTVTHVHYKLNGITSISAGGETAQEHQVVPQSSSGPLGLVTIHVGGIDCEGNTDIDGDTTIGGDASVGGDMSVGGDLVVSPTGLLNVITATGTTSVSSSSASKTVSILITPDDGWTPVCIAGFNVGQSWCFVRTARLVTTTSAGVTTYSAEVSIRYTGSSTSSQTITVTVYVLCLHTS